MDGTHLSCVLFILFLTTLTCAQPSGASSSWETIFYFDCTGTFRIAPDSIFSASVIQPAATQLYNTIFERIQDRVKCGCGTTTEEEIKARYEPLHALFDSFKTGAPYSSACLDDPQTFTRDLSKIISAWTGRDFSFDMPSTCNDLNKGCHLKFPISEKLDISFGVHLSTCVGSYLPAVSVHCVGSGCKLGHPCSSAADCGDKGYHECEKIIDFDKTLSGSLVEYELFDIMQALKFYPSKSTLTSVRQDSSIPSPADVVTNIANKLLQFFPNGDRIHFPTRSINLCMPRDDWWGEETPTSQEKSTSKTNPPQGGPTPPASMGPSGGTTQNPAGGGSQSKSKSLQEDFAEDIVDSLLAGGLSVSRSVSDMGDIGEMIGSQFEFQRLKVVNGSKCLPSETVQIRFKGLKTIDDMFGWNGMLDTPNEYAHSDARKYGTHWPELKPYGTNSDETLLAAFSCDGTASILGSLNYGSFFQVTHLHNVFNMVVEELATTWDNPDAFLLNMEFWNPDMWLCGMFEQDCDFGGRDSFAKHLFDDTHAWDVGTWSPDDKFWRTAPTVWDMITGKHRKAQTLSEKIQQHVESKMSWWDRFQIAMGTKKKPFEELHNVVSKMGRRLTKLHETLLEEVPVYADLHSASTKLKANVFESSSKVRPPKVALKTSQQQQSKVDTQDFDVAFDLLDSPLVDMDIADFFGKKFTPGNNFFQSWSSCNYMDWEEYGQCTIDWNAGKLLGRDDFKLHLTLQRCYGVMHAIPSIFLTCSGDLCTSLTGQMQCSTSSGACPAEYECTADRFKSADEMDPLGTLLWGGLNRPLKPNEDEWCRAVELPADDFCYCSCDWDKDCKTKTNNNCKLPTCKVLGPTGKSWCIGKWHANRDVNAVYTALTGRQVNCPADPQAHCELALCIPQWEKMMGNLLLHLQVCKPPAPSNPFNLPSGATNSPSQSSSSMPTSDMWDDLCAQYVKDKFNTKYKEAWFEINQIQRPGVGTPEMFVLPMFRNVEKPAPSIAKIMLSTDIPLSNFARVNVPAMKHKLARLLKISPNFIKIQIHQYDGTHDPFKVTKKSKTQLQQTDPTAIDVTVSGLLAASQVAVDATKALAADPTSLGVATNVLGTYQSGQGGRMGVGVDGVSCDDSGKPAHGARNTTELKIGTTVQYFCSSGYTLIGPETSTCLKNSTWTAPLPTCQAAGGGTPSTPTNPNDCPDPGVTAHSKRTGSQYKQGSSVRYSCHPGYVLSKEAVGVTEVTLTCQSDKTWDRKPPVCDPVSCGQPKNPENGKIEGVDFTYGATIHFKCNDAGNEISGPLAASCVLDDSPTKAPKWNAFDPKCQPVSCEEPVEPVNGKFKLESGNTKDGSMVTWECIGDYKLNGAKQSKCILGAWTPGAPRCVPKSETVCPTPTDLKNGEIVGNHYQVGATLAYDCFEGFVPSTPYTLIKCQSDGKWNENAPTCVPVQCKAPPDIPYGTHNPKNTVYNYGDEVDIVCAGKVLSGPSKIRCLEDGHWSSYIPRCVDTGTKTCQAIQPPKNGRITGSSYNVDQKIHFSCMEGFVLWGDEALTCQSDGQWDYPTPICIKGAQRCESLQAPTNGELLLGYIRGDTSQAIFSCKSSYHLSGYGVLQCQPQPSKPAAEWDNKPPTCVAATVGTCPPFDRESQHLHTSDGSNNFLVGKEVGLFCSSGYTLVGPKTLKCVDQSGRARWDQDPPICSKVCVAYTAVHGKLSPTKDYYQPGEKIKLTCDDGYKLSGTAEVACALSTADWDTPKLPVCFKGCPPPDPPTNGEIDTLKNDYNVGDKAVYKCPAGKTLIGSSSTTCQSDGTWTKSNTPPSCVAGCAAIPLPTDGQSLAVTGVVENQQAQVPPVPYGTKATYKCNDGYTLEGDTESTCSETGWSAKTTLCKKGKSNNTIMIVVIIIIVIAVIIGLVIAACCFKKRRSGRRNGKNRDRNRGSESGFGNQQATGGAGDGYGTAYGYHNNYTNGYANEYTSPYDSYGGGYSSYSTAAPLGDYGDYGAEYSYADAYSYGGGGAGYADSYANGLDYGYGDNSYAYGDNSNYTANYY